MNAHCLDKEPSHNPTINGRWKGGGGVGVIARAVTSHSSGKSISLGSSLTMLKSVLLGCSRVFSSVFLSCSYQRNAFVPTGWTIGTQCLLAVFKEKRKLEILCQLFYISQKASIWDRLSREHDVEDQIWRSEHQRTRTAGSKARGNAGNF